MKQPGLTCGRLVAATLLLSMLSGCITMVAGASIASVVSVSDRRTLGAQTDDKVIGLKASALNRKFAIGSHINTASFNRKLLLTGETSDESTKQQIESDAKAIDGVMDVSNELEIGEVSSYKSRSNDALITAKVLASLVEAKMTKTNLFKVVTERGNVYLMGRVTKEEADAGVEAVRGVTGVQKVVKIFEYQ